MPRSDSYSPYTTSPPSRARGAGKGGRRPRELEESDLTKEELEKRRLRRLRNKEAAARCRQRRLDQMDELTAKVTQLDGEIQERDAQIQQLLMEKEELEYLLRNHNCVAGKQLLRKLSNSGTSAAYTQPAVAPPQPPVSAVKMESEPTLTQVVTQSTPSDLINSLPSISEAAQRELTRPDTLGLNFQAGGTMSMDTPSSGLVNARADFDLMSIPTGLTPVANGPMAPGLTPSASAAPSAPTSSAASSLQTPTIIQRL